MEEKALNPSPCEIESMIETIVMFRKFYLQVFMKFSTSIWAYLCVMTTKRKNRTSYFSCYSVFWGRGYKYTAVLA